MAEEIKVTENQQGTPAADAVKTENMIPQSRFSEVVNERNSMKARLEELETAAKTKAEQSLIEQKKYEELYTKTKSEYDVVLKQMETVNSKAGSEIEAELKDLTPDEQNELKEFIPTGITKFEELQKIRLLKSKMYNRNKPNIPNDSGRPNGKNEQLDIEAAIKEMGDINTPNSRKVELMKKFGFGT